MKKKSIQGGTVMFPSVVCYFRVLLCIHYDCVITVKSEPNMSLLKVKQISSIKNSVEESICSLYSIRVLPFQQH